MAELRTHMSVDRTPSGPSTTPPTPTATAPSSGDKDKRYDRQIRIWGAHGQQRLESSKVVLLNCSATGAETLKNLVLGGIAAFTVVDGAKVTARDLGTNFLVDQNGLHESRAKVVTALLQEMNESVAGSYVEESPENLIASNPGFFADFSLVIATQLKEADALKLDDICRQHHVPLLLARSFGLVGYLRASLPEHLVVESKPDNVVDDLRLHTPFPELSAFAASFDLNTVDANTHLHIPFVVILLHASERWRVQHQAAGGSGAPPANAKERGEFKELVKSLCKADWAMSEHINFDDALKAAFHVWTQYSLSSEVQAILHDPATAQPSIDSDDFWIVAAGLKAFVENEGQGKLPLQGSIPDMHASTDLYLQLQRVYRDRAESDVAAVESHVQTVLHKLGRQPGSVPRDYIRLVCRNARNLRLVRYPTLAAEASSKGGWGLVLQQTLNSETSQNDASFYVLLRAADRFHAAHGRFPGSFDAQVEEDIPVLKSLANQVLSEVGASGVNVSDDCVVEMCRFGASELHAVAAVVGGMAAQEAIKLITRQFTPVGGTLLYNAIAATTCVLEP